jgi:putative transposase
MAIKKELLDELLKQVDNPEEIFGKEGLLKELTGRLVERVLEAELTDHLGYEKHNPAGRNSGNNRNGHGKKTIKGEAGQLEIKVPRDRNGSFEPQLVHKRQSRMPSFDEKILSLYARGMTTREIQGHLEELYGTEVSPTLISTVTDAVLDEVTQWQHRPLRSIYPIVYLDALFVKVRHEGRVVKKAVYLALGINLDGEKELLGMWIARSEGAKFWLGVLTELKNRGVQDIFICCVDGLSGFEEAIEAVYGQTVVQLCIVHMVRNSLRFVTWKDRKAVARDLKAIYRAATLEEAELELVRFAEQWDAQYPTISRSWHLHWDRITPFWAYPPEIRKVIYTTNAIESLNRSLRKVLKTRGALPSDEALIKLLYLALTKITKKWTLPIRDWKAALNRFAIEFEGRVPLS